MAADGQLLADRAGRHGRDRSAAAIADDAALNFADRTARTFGPLFGRHRVALDNLRKAFPEKSEDEIRAIALDMWGNMARLAAEYIYLDRLFDYDPARPNAGPHRGFGIPLYERIASEKKAHILFRAHVGNFELIPVGGETYGLYATAMFRPPNNPYIAEYILSTRRTTMGGLIASGAADRSRSPAFSRPAAISARWSTRSSGMAFDDVLRPTLRDQSPPAEACPAI